MSDFPLTTQTVRPGNTDLTERPRHWFQEVRGGSIDSTERPWHWWETVFLRDDPTVAAAEEVPDVGYADTYADTY